MDFSNLTNDELIELGFETAEAMHAASGQLDQINAEITARGLVSDLTVQASPTN